jgi:hypothetical protein
MDPREYWDEGTTASRRDTLDANGSDPRRNQTEPGVLPGRDPRPVARHEQAQRVVTALVGGLGPIEMLVLAFSLANIAVCLWAIFDAASRPENQWMAAGQSKGLWLTSLTVVAILGCFTFGWIGALLYALIPRRALVRAAVQRGE